MDDKDRRMISFQVSAEELEAIEAAATEQGISRSEYLRQKILTPTSETYGSEIEALLRHLVYTTNCTHAAVYAIAEKAGPLSTEQLREIYERLLAQGIKMMIRLPQRMAEVQAQIKAQQPDKSFIPAA